MRLTRRLAVLLTPLIVAAPSRLVHITSEPIRRVRFTTHEASWLGFDVSRDGRWIVMDLLGQLWRLPIAGGIARPITDVVRDTAEFLDPSFSPDGRTVIVHGEFRGALAVFSLPASGGSLRAIAPDTIVRGTGLVIQSPSWSPDGRRIVRARVDTALALSERDLASGQERRLDVQGLRPAKLEGPAYSADGSEVFFHTWNEEAEVFPPAGRIWRVPSAGGTARPFTPANLLVRAASPSPDGRRVAYFAFDSTSKAQVWVQSVGDTVGVQVTDDRDVTPTRVRWLPGGSALVYSESGRLWRLDVRTRVRTEIPFSATVDFVRREPTLPAVRFPAPGERMAARSESGFALSPDGRSLAIIALDRIWIAPTDRSEAAHAVVAVPPTATNPTWSPDGRQIAWHAGPLFEEQVYVTDTVTRRTRRAASLSGYTARGAWSPDGRQLLLTSAAPDSSGRLSVRIRVVSAPDSLGPMGDGARELGPWNAFGAEARPQWSPRGDAVLVVGRSGSARNRPATLRFPDGSQQRIVGGLPFDATWVRWLAGDTLVFIRAFRLWTAPFDVSSATIGEARMLSEAPVVEFEVSLGGDIVFRGESGFRYRSRTGNVRTIGWPVRYDVPTPRPLVIRNVRIIDGTGAGATSPKDIAVVRGRISAIAAAGTITPPPDAEVVEGAGRTAIPGLIDLHNHFQTPAVLRGALYYGVTTIRLIGSPLSVDNIFSGAWPGPRFSQARLTVNPDVVASSNSWDVSIMRTSDSGYLDRGLWLAAGVGSDQVKIHTFSGWATQVRTVVGAHERGMRVLGHCAFPLTLVAAGMDSKEHLGWQCSVHDAGTWYDDLIQLHVKSGVAIVPTRAMFSNTHRLRGTPEPPAAEVTDLFGKTELAAVTRSLTVLSRITPGNAADLRHQTEQLRKLHRAGALIGTGTDFERPDGLQYELEALVEASLSPLEAISSATSVAARIIGASSEVGRIAPGLIADIVLLDADPAMDIRNARKVSAVIQGGRLVDRRALVAPGWNAVP